MTTGVFVNENGKLLMGVRNHEYSIKELRERNGFPGTSEVQFISGEKLNEDPLNLRGHHKIHEDGTVEDTRSIVGYRARLKKKVDVGGKKFDVDGKTVKVDKKGEADKLAQRLGMEVEDIKPIKR